MCRCFSPAAVIVAAHPDDESIGTGIWIYRHSNMSVHVLHITDGSPHDMTDAKALGFQSRRSYALARRKEFAEAMSLLNIPSRRCHHFNAPDKAGHLHFADL